VLTSPETRKKYLEIVEAFYADNIEGSSETMEEPIRGKARVRSRVFRFLVRLHAMAEVGGVSISIRETPIPGDVIEETRSAWTLEFIGVSGNICTVSWRTFRKWNELRVVMEHHYEQQQSGEPLTHDDLWFDAPEAAIEFQRPS
jgi:hypothetical protein